MKSGRIVIPGHGFVADYGDLVEYRNVVTIVRDRIQDMVGKGMTLEQVKAADPTKGFRKRYGSDTGQWTTDMFVEAVYRGREQVSGWKDEAACAGRHPGFAGGASC